MKTTAVYFSPTGNTKKSVDAMARALDADYQAVDLTVAQGEDGQEFPVQMRFSGEDFVIFGMPVYGGRLPALAAKRLSGLYGEQTPCVLVVTYGNRHYDDALVDYLTEKSFSMTYGARNLRRTIQRELEDPMATQIIDSYEHPISQVRATVENDAIKLYTL